MRVDFKEFDLCRKFGVELELSATISREEIRQIILNYDLKREVGVTVGSGSYGWAETRCNDFWHVKYDSTCGPLGRGRDFGWEIASYIASSVEDIDNISGLAHHLCECNLQTNDHCGFHVHAEVKDFSPQDMGVLIAQWVKIEPWLYFACPFRRFLSTHCRSLRVRMKDKNISYQPSCADAFWFGMMPTSTNVHNNPEKKYSLNTVGYVIGQINRFYDRVTVEMRLPECSLDKKHVKNWILLFLNFIETCKRNNFAPQNVDQCKNVSDVLDVLGLGNSPHGKFQILDHVLFDVKVWYLKKLIQNGNKNVRKQAEEHLEFITSI